MALEITRRDILKFCGGAAVGTLLSPLPWGVMDDLAIWTQNPARVPKLPRGEVTTRFTGCAVCPAGCGVRARCVGGRPVGLAGVPGHPAGGALCPLGFAGHHLPYHPARLRTPVRRLRREGGRRVQVPTSLEAAAAAVASAVMSRSRRGSAEYVAILDTRPGRALSSLYRRFLASFSEGLYIVSPAPEEASLDVLQGMIDSPPGIPGYDLESCRTFLSFGAPLLEGWGGPARIARLRFGAASGDGRPRFLHAETRPSGTALFADRWLALEPGTEGALALGIAHVILQEGLCDESELRRRAADFETGTGRDYRSLVAAFDPVHVSRITGLEVGEIVATAREFAREGPSLAIGAGLDPVDHMAVAGLNFLAGSVGRKGGVLFRESVPETAYPPLPARNALSLAEVPDNSLRVVILDASPGGTPFGWEDLERKLVREGALVVSLSPFEVGHALHADAVVPAPAWLEGFEEIGTPPGSPLPLFGISAPMLPAPEGVLDRAELILRVASLTGAAVPGGSTEALLREKTRAIFESGRGEVFRFRDASRSPVSASGSPEGLWKALLEGGCWVGDPGSESAVTSFRLLGRGGDRFSDFASRASAPSPQRIAGEKDLPLVVIPFRPGDRGEGAVPLLSSKLDRESGLRPSPGCALVHPETGRSGGLRDGRPAWIETASGRLRVTAKFDASVKRGVVHLAIGPGSRERGEPSGGILRRISLGGVGFHAPGRPFRARMREA